MDVKSKLIEAVIDRLAKLPPDVLGPFVSDLENTEPGQLAVAANPDRRIYAVLKPTHEEYLQRCEALMNCSDKDLGEAVCSVFCKLLPLTELIVHVCGYYKTGHISFTAFTGLMQDASNVEGSMRLWLLENQRREGKGL